MKDIRICDSGELELAEEYTPNAIWNIETGVEYFEESIESLIRMGYIK